MLTRWRYTMLFVMLVLVVVALPVLRLLAVPTDAMVLVLLLAGGAAIRAAGFENRRVTATLLVLFVSYLVLSVWAYVAPGSGPSLVAHVVGFVFFAAAVVAICRDVFHEREVTLDVIMGAAAVYLLLGLVWSRLYMVVELAAPGSFALAEHLEANVTGTGLGEDSILVYFSYVTLSTLGYGDVTPVTELTRRIAMLQAIIGQLYIAITVAWLVSRYSASGPREDD